MPGIFLIIYYFDFLLSVLCFRPLVHFISSFSLPFSSSFTPPHHGPLSFPFSPGFLFSALLPFSSAPYLISFSIFLLTLFSFPLFLESSPCLLLLSSSSLIFSFQSLLIPFLYFSSLLSYSPPLHLLSFSIFLLSLPYNISLSHFHSPPLSLFFSLPPLFFNLCSLLPSFPTISSLFSPLLSLSPRFLLIFWLFLIVPPPFPYLFFSFTSFSYLPFYNLSFLSSTPLHSSTLLSSPFTSTSSTPPYTPPLFCVCVWVCAAVVFRRCVQLICAASLLPQTPSLCKYLSPQYVTVCTSVCVRVRKWLLASLCHVSSRVRSIIDLRTLKPVSFYDEWPKTTLGLHKKHLRWWKSHFYINK